jgi:beta-galactosidase
MKVTLQSFVFAALSIALPALARSPKPLKEPLPVRDTQPFDASWRFQKGDPAGAEKPAFGDAAWRIVNLPHDWSIEGPFDEKNPTGGAGAFLPSGVAWYRKSFTLPVTTSGRRVFVEFDGVMQNSDVWINGQKLGHRPFGYASFRYELSDHVKFGPDAINVIAVRADTSAQPASRWYSGAGIYRHVRLILADPLHIDQWATFVTTPQVTSASASVHVTTRVVNQSQASRDVALQINLLDPSGKNVATANVPAQSIAVGASVAFTQDFTLANPQLWDLATPQLYRAVIAVRSGDQAVDDETTRFGIRDAHFESATGFWLNGRNFKIKGVCVHHEGGAFGAAVPMSVWEQRLDGLRSLGVNAIRTAHNPPDPAFLDLCDRKGFLVMDELFDCWTVAKTPYDYHLFFYDWAEIDARDTVRRDRNHPSVILYSSGNEIHDTPKEALAKSILSNLVPVFHENDPTRPVTQALFRPNVSHDYTNGLADLLDVIGTNYRDNELLVAWKQKPGRKIIGTEQGHTRQTWLEARDNPPHSGQFLWSGVDYLGESRSWPTVSAGSGLLDRTGGVKPMALERRSWWSETPVVGIVRRTAASRAGPTDPGFTPLTVPQVQFADWTPRNVQPHQETVEIYSNCDEVELFLNGQSLGAKPINSDASPRIWQVAYAPGTLRAVAKTQGKVVATDELRTAGPAARIALTADRTKASNEWDDVVRITALVVDANGVPVPDAGDSLTFSAAGNGAIVAVDNADSRSHESFQATTRAAFHGRCVTWVRSNATSGKITVTATAAGLAPGSVTLAAAGR